MTVINQTWKFVYVHIPKCGGTSVTQTLRKICTWSDLLLGGTEFGEVLHAAYQKEFNISKHSFAEELRDRMGANDFAQYVSFATIRDPLERTISTFRYLKHHEDHYAFMQPIESFDDFIASEQWQGPGPDRMYLPQLRWLNAQRFNTGRIVDRLIRLERLADVLPNLLIELGVPAVKARGLSIQDSNASPKSISVDISAETLEKINKRYEWDYKALGYTPREAPDQVSEAAK